MALFLFILQHIDRGIPKRTTVMQIKTVAPSTAAMKMVKAASKILSSSDRSCLPSPYAGPCITAVTLDRFQSINVCESSSNNSWNWRQLKTTYFTSFVFSSQVRVDACLQKSSPLQHLNDCFFEEKVSQLCHIKDQRGHHL